MTRSRWAWSVALVCNLGLLIAWLWTRPPDLPLPGSQWIAWPRWITQIPSWLQGLSLPDDSSPLPYLLLFVVLMGSVGLSLVRLARWKRKRVSLALDSLTAWSERLTVVDGDASIVTGEQSSPWSEGLIRLIAGERRPLDQVVAPFSSAGLPVLLVGDGASRRALSQTLTAKEMDFFPVGTSPDKVLAWCLTHVNGVVVVDGLTALEGVSDIDVLSSTLLEFARTYRTYTVPMASVVVLEPAPIERMVLDRRLRAQCVAAGIELWSVVEGDCRPIGSGAPFEFANMLLASSAARTLNQGAQRWFGRFAALAAAAVFALLALTLMAPAFFSGPQKTVLVGDTARGLSGSLWGNWWVFQAFEKGEFLEAFWSPAVFWPEGASLIAIFGSVLSMLVSVPFQWLGPYPGYWNLFVICAFISSGLAARALALSVGLSRQSALLVGAVFAFSPVMLSEVSAGHQIQFWAFSLPLAILY